MKRFLMRTDRAAHRHPLHIHSVDELLTAAAVSRRCKRRFARIVHAVATTAGTCPFPTARVLSTRLASPLLAPTILGLTNSSSLRGKIVADDTSPLAPASREFPMSPSHRNTLVLAARI